MYTYKLKFQTRDSFMQNSSENSLTLFQTLHSLPTGNDKKSPCPVSILILWNKKQHTFGLDIHQRA